MKDKFVVDDAGRDRDARKRMAGHLKYPLHIWAMEKRDKQDKHEKEEKTGGLYDSHECYSLLQRRLCNFK